MVRGGWATAAARSHARPSSCPLNPFDSGHQSLRAVLPSSVRCTQQMSPLVWGGAWCQGCGMHLPPSGGLGRCTATAAALPHTLATFLKTTFGFTCRIADPIQRGKANDQVSRKLSERRKKLLGASELSRALIHRCIVLQIVLCHPLHRERARAGLGPQTVLQNPSRKIMSGCTRRPARRPRNRDKKSVCRRST